MESKNFIGALRDIELQGSDIFLIENFVIRGLLKKEFIISF